MMYRTTYNYMGLPTNTFPNNTVACQVACDCGGKAERVVFYKLYRCDDCGREYTRRYGEYVLIEQKGDACHEGK